MKPPAVFHVLFTGRMSPWVHLFLIVAHHGLAAAVRISRSTEMERLGIRLSPAAARVQRADAWSETACPFSGAAGVARDSVIAADDGRCRRFCGGGSVASRTASGMLQTVCGAQVVRSSSAGI